MKSKSIRTSNEFHDVSNSEMVVSKPADALALLLSEDDTALLTDIWEGSLAPRTLKGYQEDWGHFKQWCIDTGRHWLPPSPTYVSLHLAEMALGRKNDPDVRRVATIERRLAAISYWYKKSKLPNPAKSVEVRTAMATIKKKCGRPQIRKNPVTFPHLMSMVECCPDDLSGLRDKALLLLGFGGAFRRSELVALNIDDISFTSDGMKVMLLRSKTDQEGEGRILPIKFDYENPCPVAALKAWLAAASIRDGAIFRGVCNGKLKGDRLCDKSVALIVKRYAKRIGLDVKDFSGHSLRAGLATSAARGGATRRKIMDVTGHKSEGMTERYIRDANIFEDTALEAARRDVKK